VLNPIGARNVPVGATLTFTVSGSDPDGDPLTFSAAPLPPNASFDSSSQTFAFTPVPGQAGTTQVTFSVEDGRGGMASETITLAVAAGISVSITSPLPGATVAAGLLLVRGTVETGGAEVGIAANGVPAAISGATFAVMVPVDPTVTLISAEATTQGGAHASVTVGITVVSSTDDTPLVRAVPAFGAAPLAVRLSVLTAPSPATFEVDANGDGATDFTGATLRDQVFSYAQPGLYFPRVTVNPQTGAPITLTTLVQVLDPQTLDALLQSRWNALRNALVQGNVAAAVDVFAGRSREAYRQQFAALAGVGGLVQVGVDLGPIRLVRFLDGAAEYDLRAIRAGQEYSFHVRFVVDDDGLWRLWAF
jgi:hypothetical protein